MSYILCICSLGLAARVEIPNLCQSVYAKFDSLDGHLQELEAFVGRRNLVTMKLASRPTEVLHFRRTFFFGCV